MLVPSSAQLLLPLARSLTAAGLGAWRKVTARIAIWREVVAEDGHFIPKDPSAINEETSEFFDLQDCLKEASEIASEFSWQNHHIEVHPYAWRITVRGNQAGILSCLRFIMRAAIHSLGPDARILLSIAQEDGSGILRLESITTSGSPCNLDSVFGLEPLDTEIDVSSIYRFSKAVQTAGGYLELERSLLGLTKISIGLPLAG